MTCALIGMSLKFATPNYGPAFRRSYLHVASNECMLVDMISVCPGSSEPNLGHDSEGQVALPASRLPVLRLFLKL